MSKVCVPGGQVPVRTLVRVFDLRIFTIIDDFARLEPPWSCCAQPELNLHPHKGRFQFGYHLFETLLRCHDRSGTEQGRWDTWAAAAICSHVVAS
jgi:hypothetical protein